MLKKPDTFFAQNIPKNSPPPNKTGLPPPPVAVAVPSLPPISSQSKTFWYVGGSCEHLTSHSIGKKHHHIAWVSSKKVMNLMVCVCVSLWIRMGFFKTVMNLMGCVYIYILKHLNKNGYIYIYTYVCINWLIVWIPNKSWVVQSCKSSFHHRALVAVSIASMRDRQTTTCICAIVKSRDGHRTFNRNP